MKKKVLTVICLILAMFSIMTMTGCGGGETEPTEPKIKTTIDPKNWARVEDYKDYDVPVETVEPEVTEPVVTEPVETEPVETEPVVEETEPAPEVLYSVAKEGKSVMLSISLSDVMFGEDAVNLLTASMDDMEAMGFAQGEAVQNSGVWSQYLFDGFSYTRADETIAIETDDAGSIVGLKLLSERSSLMEGKVHVGMTLESFYDEISNVLAPEHTLARMTPADGVSLYLQFNSPGYRALVTATSEGVTEIAIFAEDHVLSWGPIQN